MKQIPDILPNRLNYDAIVFRGCTMKEIQVIALVSLVLSLIIMSLVAELLFGNFLYGIALSFMTAFGMGWLLASAYQRLKQNKPKGYVKQVIVLWLEDKGLYQTPYIRHQGRWSVGRFFS